MDTSKAIGIIITNPKFEDVRSLEGVAPTKNPCIPIIAVPTPLDKIKEEDLDTLATDALNDACYPGNPREATKEQVIEMFRMIMAK